jgi:serine acetyltransferase
VGAGAIVLKSVPHHCTVVGNPAKAVSDKKSELMLNDLGAMPDPIHENFRKLEQEISHIKRQIHAKNKN